MPKPFSKTDLAKLLATAAPLAADSKNDPVLKIAALMKVSPAEAARIAEAHAEELDAEVLRAEVDGTMAVSLSERGILLGVRRIVAQLESDEELDVAEVVDLLKPLHRILEARDRLKLAERETTAPLIIDVSRLPGVREALTAGPTDPTAHLKKSPLVLDAPEPKFGASGQTVTNGKGANV